MKSNNQYQQNPFCITLINLSSKEEADFNQSITSFNKIIRLTIRSEKKVSDAIYSESVVHAIVFNHESLNLITNEDENIIRSASKSGTCRIYLLAQNGSILSYENSRLDDFIQRTSQHSIETITQEILSFFREADQLNHRSTLFAFRDLFCLSAYKIFKILWPISYIATAILILNTIDIIAGFKLTQGLLALEYVIPIFIFFGIFFIVHGIITIMQNWLFGLHFARKFNFEFAIGVLSFLIAITATSYSILIIEHDLLHLSAFLMINVGLHLFYIYARRIRAELTSISGLQTKMTQKAHQIETLKNIGKEPFEPSAFPLFLFRKKSLFISYMHSSKWSSDNAALAHNWASANGYKVFLDRSTIPSGTLWCKYLLQSVSECVFFVAIIDGDAVATEWVLAESAYAALLRKNVGKPRILLVIRNLQKISQDKQNPFHLNYLDLFQIPKEYCYGAGILSTDCNDLSEERFLQAMNEIRPMSLLFSNRKATHTLYEMPKSTLDKTNSSTSQDFQIIDKAWKSAVLLVKLMEILKWNRFSLNLLVEKSHNWVNSNNSEKITVGLYTLMYLLKNRQLPNNKDLNENIQTVFMSNESVVVRLAALDFLCNLKTTENPLSLIPDIEANHIVDFRSVLIQEMKASQRKYVDAGVLEEIGKESEAKSMEATLLDVIHKVDNISTT